mmetsp:Transcript_48490/g.127700  ORF Transcript_48490/g.127700 Transcript_48490/m.127700 type:complete len:244 (-) Transcript_48490:48-779(-)
MAGSGKPGLPAHWGGGRAGGLRQRYGAGHRCYGQRHGGARQVPLGHKPVASRHVHPQLLHAPHDGRSRVQEGDRARQVCGVREVAARQHADILGLLCRPIVAVLRRVPRLQVLDDAGAEEPRLGLGQGVARPHRHRRGRGGPGVGAGSVRLLLPLACAEADHGGGARRSSQSVGGHEQGASSARGVRAPRGLRREPVRHGAVAAREGAVQGARGHREVQDDERRDFLQETFYKRQKRQKRQGR